MRTSNGTPSEIIDYIGDIIKERQHKSLPTFYTISIEQYEKITPVAEKEEGYDNFKKQVLKYMSDYDLTALTIQLFSGKSRNVKSPFQTFKVPLKKHNPPIVLGGIEKHYPNEVQQLDSSIPVGRYYDEKFELQMRIMRSEMEKQSLTERLSQLTERYEDKLKEQGKHNEEKIKNLEQEIQNLEEDIKDFEKEIAKNEKEKHNSFGNIALGSISARAIENLAKSDIGTGVLKGLLGTEGYQTLQGHLAGIEIEKNKEPEPPNARIISEAEHNSSDPRQAALQFIQKTGQGLNDRHLRMLYDIASLAYNNLADLEVFWSLAQQIIQKRKQPITEPKKSESGKEDTNTTEETEEETNDIP